MRKTQTKLPSEGKTSIRPKLNVRKDTTSDHYTVVIQIIRHRRRCVLFTPYRLRKEEFDDMRGIAITRQRNRTHREYIGQVNDYLRYHTGELYRLVHSMEQSGNPFEASDVLAHYRQRDDKRYVETYLLHLVKSAATKDGTARHRRSYPRYRSSGSSPEEDNFCWMTWMNGKCWLSGTICKIWD